MNDLILRSLKWIIKNTETKRQNVNYNERDSILIDIDMVLNPEEVETLQDKKCPYCSGLIKIRNPTGNCDHLYYPELVNKDYPKKQDVSLKESEVKK